MNLNEELQKKLALGQQYAQQRQQLVNQVNAIDAEMLRLQGEVRLLQQLIDELMEETEEEEDASSG